MDGNNAKTAVDPFGRSMTERLSRRSILKRAAVFGLAAPAISTLLAACETDDDEEVAAEPDDDEEPVDEPDDDDDEEPVDEPDDDDDEEPVEEPVDDDDDDVEDDVDEPVDGGQVHVRWANPRSMNGLFSSAAQDQSVQRLIFGALVMIDHELLPQPDLAETIDVTEDATTWTFELKDGITFSDGEPFSVDDVVFTLERAVDQRTNSIWRGRLLQIEGAREYGDQETDSISGLNTPDDQTIEITLSEPNSVFLFILGNFAGLGILPKHVLEDVEPSALEEHPFSRHPTVSAGAFQMVSFEEDQVAELARNPHYGHGPTPQIESIFMRMLEIDTALVELDRGNLDLVGGVRIEDLERLEQNPDVEVESIVGSGFARIPVDLTRAEFQDKQVRQAMMYALDRETIIEDILHGEAELLNHPLLPDWMLPVEGIIEYHYDPERSRAMLEEAGWDESQEFEFVYETDAVVGAICAIFQEQLQEVGVNVQLVELGQEETQRRLWELEFDFFAFAFTGGGGMFRGDPSEMERFYTRENFSPTGSNFNRYENDRVEELLTLGRTQVDQGERRETYTEIIQIVNDECPWLWLWGPNRHYGISRRLGGFIPTPHDWKLVDFAADWHIRD